MSESESWLPEDMMLAEDDQILAALTEACDAATWDSSYQAVCDMLDPIDADADELIALNDEERRLILLYAKLGRNAYMRHLQERQQDK